MPTPGEHKTIQSRILAYAQEVGRSIVSREEAERRRGFDPALPPADRARNRSLIFDALLAPKVRTLNPRYAESAGALLGLLPPSPRLRRTGRLLHGSTHGNRDFLFPPFVLH
jgi:type I restriction enzyme R subunit